LSPAIIAICYCFCLLTITVRRRPYNHSMAGEYDIAERTST
jgi:hypothetical protein